jgi:hypothetical protein
MVADDDSIEPEEPPIIQQEHNATEKITTLNMKREK